MKNWILMIILFGICLLGFMKLLHSKRESDNEKKYAISFINKFGEFCNELVNGNYNSDNYEWLKLNSAKMQTQMGEYGIAAGYKPAFSNFMFNNYQMIVNGISNIRTTYRHVTDFRSSSNLGNKLLNDEISGIEDMILTYVGALDSVIGDKTKVMKNPLIWFREGVRTVVTLPISLVYWSGLIRYTTYNKLANNFFVKLISSALTLIGLVSSVVTITTGYAPFIEIIDKIKL